MLKPIMKVCQVLGIGFLIAGFVGLGTLRGRLASDALLMVTGGLLLYAYKRLELVDKQTEHRAADK